MYLKDIPPNTRIIQEGDIGTIIFVSLQHSVKFNVVFFFNWFLDIQVTSTLVIVCYLYWLRCIITRKLVFFCCGVTSFLIIHTIIQICVFSIVLISSCFFFTHPNFEYNNKKRHLYYKRECVTAIYNMRCILFKEKGYHAYLQYFINLQFSLTKVGSHLYVSEKGMFEVYQGPIYESNFGPGVAFGELALLYNTKRLRSVDGTDQHYSFLPNTVLASAYPQSVSTISTSFFQSSMAAKFGYWNAVRFRLSWPKKTARSPATTSSGFDE